MTPEEVSKLTDAELAAACAEHVMGWKRVDIPTYKSPGWGDPTGAFLLWPHNWQPATDLDQAAQCTGAMLAKGWIVEIESCKGQTGSYHWACIMYKDADDGFGAETYAATEPRARAEAALLAALKERESDV